MVRVLYVSGDPDARDRVATGLPGADEGLSVVTADGVGAVRDDVGTAAVDCVVTDHDPPATDGLAVVRAVREAAAGVPVVVFTGAGSERVASDASAAGAAGYLVDDGSLAVLADRLVELAGDATVAADPDRARMFSTLVSNLPGMAYRCRNDVGWPMTFVTEGAAELTGYRPDRIEAGDVSWGEDVIHPADRESVYEAVQEAVADDEPFTVTYRIHTKDGAERWVWEQGRAADDATADGTVLEGFVTDITEQRERERRLDAIFNGTYQFTGLMEPDGTLIEANETALEFGGIDRDDVIGEYVWDTHWWQTDAATAERVEAAVERAAQGEFVRYEAEVQGDDETRTIDFSIRPLTDEDGTVKLLIPEGRDITERRRREEQLESLNDLARTLAAATGVGEICRAAVEAASETLELELATVERYDEDAGELVPCARTDAVVDLVGDEPLFEGERGEDWQTYVEADGTVFEDISARSDIATTGTPLDSAIVLPLGRHGVLIAGSTTPEPFTDTEVDLARTLAAHTETTFDRLDRERSLRERTETLERKTERLARTDRTNEVLRAVVDEVCEASSRATLETGVCQRLVDSGPYRFVWIGSEDPVSGALEPTASAGDGDGYLESVTVLATGEESDPEPTARAFRAGEPRAVADVRTDPPMAQWRQEALVRDFRAVLSVPITHLDARYGTLTLYGESRGQFEGVERDALADLGRLLGYAITASQRKRSLAADSVVELEFQVAEPGQGLFALLDGLEGAVEIQGLVSHGDRPLRAFLLRPADEAGAVESAAADTPGISNVRRVSADDDNALYEVAVAERGTLANIVEHGARLRAVDTDGARLQFVVELPAVKDVREFAETVERGAGDTDLVARRERDRPLRTTHRFRDRVRQELTDRQLEALQTAYISGFFEWPREKTGQEVAALLDVSQPTFNRHFRAAQLAVFELLFDG